MKKAGFTLAEVLITLMILGIIAALTIPSLIQNTQKKEEVVQLKKGLSMINQAITMNYALEQEDLTQAGTGSGEKGLVTVLTERLAVTESGSDYVKTQDGLTYYVKQSSPASTCSSTGAVSSDGTTNKCYDVIISVRPDSETSYSSAYAQTPENTATTKSALTGYYQFYAGSDRVVPSDTTANILYAKDATKQMGGSV